MGTIGDAVARYGLQQLGDPYVWGAEGPNSFDCSGLLFAAYKAAGINVQRTTAAAWGRMGRSVTESDAVPGDVVYFDEPGATDHVGIYLGGGQMVQAPQEGDVVKISGVGHPTSFRRITDTVSNDAGDGLPGSNTSHGPLGALTDALGAWQNPVLAIVLKGIAGAFGVALVVVGAKEALSEKGTA